jgi:hypothetical protein
MLEFNLRIDEFDFNADIAKLNNFKNGISWRRWKNFKKEISAESS